MDATDEVIDPTVFCETVNLDDYRTKMSQWMGVVQTKKAQKRQKHKT